MKPGIDNIRGFGEIQRSYNWGISFTGTAPIWGKAAGISANKQLYKCTSVQLPTIATTMLDINIRGVRLKQPATVNYSGDMMVTFVENEAAEVRQMLAVWANAQWDCATQTKSVGTSQNNNGLGVGATMMLYHLSTDGQIATAKYELQRCFLKDYTIPKLSSDSSNMEITATISVSRILPYSIGESVS